jgi:hypothetical protein
MKSRLTGLCNTTSKLSESVRQRISRFAIATILAGVSLLALVWPAAAEIVYTPANITIRSNQSYNLDLNHDGVTDFTITTTYWSYGNCASGSVSETAASGNGAEYSPLKKGDQIGPSQTFLSGSEVMAYGFTEHYARGGGCYPCCEYEFPWANTTAYLGAMFQINGQTYYGWAWLNVGWHSAVLKGYAYESTPGTPINAGQTPTGFTITASPTSATVSPGQSTTSILTLTPVDGFSGTVSVTCKVPSGYGLSCGVSPGSVTLDGTDPATATLSINASSTTPAGTYKINAKGAYYAIVHSTAFTLTVQ